MENEYLYLYHLAVGPGCPDMEIAGNGTVQYRMDKDTLVADVHCPPGYVLGDTGTNWKTVTCLEDPTSGTDGARWSATLKECICEYQKMYHLS